jgi:predicted  nucleic acid-binding Zn-ribbon protein
MAARAGKTSPVVIVFLVSFILLSLILAVTTYLGFSGQSDLYKEAKKQADEKEKQKNDADYYEFVASTVLAYEGHELSPKQKEILPSLRRGFDTGSLVTNSRDPHKDATVKVIKDLDANFGWDANTNRALKSYKSEFEQQQKQLKEVTDNWQKAQDDVKAAREAAGRDQKALDAAKAEYQANLAKAKDDADKALAKELAKNADLNNQKEELGKSREDLRTEMAEQKANYEKQIAQLNKDRKSLGQRVEKAESKFAPVSVLDYDHPKGRVIRIDQSGRMVYLDLGSGDNLKTGITFSVYGVGPDGKPIAHDVLGVNGKPVIGPDGRPEKEGKATIEVSNILGEHASQARVTWVRDEGRDPIVRGDELFNPGWDPKARQHVAVTGLVDLSGEGGDTMQEFLRMLQRQGVVVDAYLDLKDISIKGRGIDRTTDYLILGTVPTFAGFEVAKEDDPRAKRQQAIIKEMTDMQQKAIDNGVTLITLRKFLVMSGVHVPPGVGVDVTPTSSRLSGGAAPARKPAADKDNPPADKEK